MKTYVASQCKVPLPYDNLLSFFYLSNEVVDNSWAMIDRTLLRNVGLYMLPSSEWKTKEIVTAVDFNAAKYVYSLRGMKISNHMDGGGEAANVGETSGSMSRSKESNKEILDVLNQFMQHNSNTPLN